MDEKYDMVLLSFLPCCHTHRPADRVVDRHDITRGPPIVSETST